MRITDLLNQNGIELGVKADFKEAAIDRLVNLMEKAGNISDKAAYKGYSGERRDGDYRYQRRHCHPPCQKCGCDPSWLVGDDGARGSGL